MVPVARPKRTSVCIFNRISKEGGYGRHTLPKIVHVGTRLLGTFASCHHPLFAPFTIKQHHD